MNGLLLAAVVLWGIGAASITCAAPPLVSPPHNLEITDLDPWLDGIIPYALQSADIPGAMVVIVKDGQILTERGFGYADLQARKPVDPQSTLFRPGSVSKLFTWTAVLQQVEAGALALDADVNQYLDFNIPARNGQPVTVRNLLTHTAGFEDAMKHLYAADAKSMLTLGAYLKAWIPHRIYPAGEQAAYSNYGAALAGYIVERVSGEPFNRYVERHIFSPLGMGHSTFDQPLPARLAGDMAAGYSTASRQPGAFELVNCAPAGSLSTTAHDMSKFMIAHLGGETNDTPILRAATARLMHAQTFVPTPPLPGMALGFYHEDRNGHVIIGHAGDTGLFHSDFHLFLDDHVGLFVSFNSAGRNGAVGQVRAQLFREFSDRYFPAARHEAQPTWPDAKTDGAAMVGSYILNRRSDSSFLRVLSALERVQVTQDGDGLLTVSAPPFRTPGGGTRKWREVAHLDWQEVDSDRHLAPSFVNGRYLGFTSDIRPPVMLLQPAPYWANLTPLYLATVYLLLLMILWPVSAGIRARFGQPLSLSESCARAYRLTRLGALADLLVLGGWITLLAVMVGGDIAEQNDAVDPWLRSLRLCGFVPIGVAAIGAWSAVLVWRDPGRPWPAKLNALLVFLAFLTIVFDVFSLHLIGWSVDF